MVLREGQNRLAAAPRFQHLVAGVFQSGAQGHTTAQVVIREKAGTVLPAAVAGSPY